MDILRKPPPPTLLRRRTNTIQSIHPPFHADRQTGLERAASSEGTSALPTRQRHNGRCLHGNELIGPEYSFLGLYHHHHHQGKWTRRILTFLGWCWELLGPTIIRIISVIRYPLFMGFSGGGGRFQIRTETRRKSKYCCA